MWRDQKRIRVILFIVAPSVLLALLAFQDHRCNNIIKLRNPYVLEQLTVKSDWIWTSLSEKSSFVNSSNKTQVADKQNDGNTEEAKDSHKSVLHEQLPPFIVHYLWCIDGHFELNHYLSVLSAIYFLHPDELIIHYRKKPRADPQGYWRWLEDLQRDVIFLTLKPLKDDSSCHFDVDKVGSDFSDHSGVFLLGDVVITNLSRSYMVQHYTKGNDIKQKYRHGEEKEKRKNQLFIVSNLEPYQVSSISEQSILRCPSFADVYNQKHIVSANCVSLNKYLHSEEILIRDTAFNRFIRKMLYGSENTVQGKKYSSVQIPNVVHLVLQDDVKELTPLLYVSIKSAFFKGQVDSVFVHSLHRPSGELWDMLKAKDNLNVIYVKAEASAHTDVKHPYMMYALYTLLQHGGIVHFGDVIFVSPIPEVTRSVGAVISPHYSRYRLKHRSMNTDVIAGAKGSEFIEAMLAMVRQHKSTYPESRVDDIASHVVEQIPESIALDGKLTSHQVCFETHCEVEGGHALPQEAYTTRLRWNGQQPKSLQELKTTEGPFRKEIIAIIAG